jgi:Protein of unknown function (DUF4232)
MARLGAWLLIVAAVVPACGVARSRPPARSSVGPSAGPVPSRVALESLRMITPQVGWAVSVDDDGNPRGVVRTTDGGRVWSDAGPPGLNQPSSPASSDSANPPAPSQLRVCETSQLKITMAWSGVAAGTIGGRIGFTNLGSRPCRLHGWPVLVAINAAGQSHTAVDKLTTMFGPNLKAAPVVILKPRATAEAVFTGSDHSRSGTCPPQYRRLRVTPPGNSQAVTIRAWIPYYDNYLPACTPIWVSEVVAFKDLYQP